MLKLVFALYFGLRRPSRFRLFFLVLLPFSAHTQSLKPVSVHGQQLHTDGKFAPVGLFPIPSSS